MLKRVRLKNFSCYEDQEVVFTDGRGTVKQKVFLLGENGSGKTKFLESFAFFKKITMGLMINERFDNTDFRFEHEIDRFNLKDDIDYFTMIGKKRKMSLEFDFQLEGSHLSYYIEFSNDKEVAYEKLYKKTARKDLLFFEREHSKLEFGYGIVLNRKDALVQSVFAENYHSHSVLGVLSYLWTEDKIEIKDDLANLLYFILSSFVRIKDYFYGLNYYTFMHDIVMTPSEGVVDLHTKERLEQSCELMNGLLNYFYPHLHRLEYEFSDERDGLYETKIFIYKKFKQQTVKITREHFSNGLVTMLYLSYSLLAMYEGKFVVVDDYTENVQYKTLEHLINATMIEFEQQAILTLNDLDALDIIDPNSLYISYYNDGNHYIEALNDIDAIRANHNIRKRYIEGVYVKDMQYGKIPFKKINEYRINNNYPYKV